jgi:hypothetical protein
MTATVTRYPGLVDPAGTSCRRSATDTATIRRESRRDQSVILGCICILGSDSGVKSFFPVLYVIAPNELIEAAEADGVTEFTVL